MHNAPVIVAADMQVTIQTNHQKLLNLKKTTIGHFDRLITNS